MENLKKIQTIGKISKIVALVVCGDGFCADRRDSVREHSRKLAFRIGTGERHGGNRQLAVRLERSA